MKAVSVVVALLAEGVDRNQAGGQQDLPHPVALLAEGVDRNMSVTGRTRMPYRRPPRGGRG